MIDFHTCQHCGISFRTHRRDAKYCSSECRMKAAYQRKKESDPRRGWTAGEKRADSLLSYHVQFRCEWCGKTTVMTGSEAKGRVYCSNKCKQTAYRHRKTKGQLDEQRRKPLPEQLANAGLTPVEGFNGCWTIEKNNATFWFEIQPGLLPGSVALYAWYREGKATSTQIYDTPHEALESLTSYLKNFRG